MKLVLSADQAANYSEMAILLKALVARGHECNFIFPVNSVREAANAREIDELRSLSETGLLSKLTILDLEEVVARSHPLAPKPAERPPTPAKELSGKEGTRFYRSRNFYEGFESVIVRLVGLTFHILAKIIFRLFYPIYNSLVLSFRTILKGLGWMLLAVLKLAPEATQRRAKTTARTMYRKLLRVAGGAGDWMSRAFQATGRFTYRACRKAERKVLRMFRAMRQMASRGYRATRRALSPQTWSDLLTKVMRGIVRRFWRGGKLYGMERLVSSQLNTFMENYYRGILEGLQEELARWKPDAVILPEEVVGPFWSSMVGACQRTGVPVLVTPYTIANQQEAFESLKKREEFQTERNLYSASRYPKWRMRSEGYDIVRLPEAHILAHQKLGLAPADPWMMNSGALDMICVESEAIGSYFEKSGIPRKRITVTGSAALDEIHERLRHRDETVAQLRADAGISGEKPILLIGGCPNQLRGVVPYCEHSSMEEIVAFVASALADVREHYDMLVRPHPTFTELGEMFAQHGFHSTMIPTANVVPVSATYIAFASATIRWAIACGIPTVNYDVFGYDYADFKGVAGVFNVASKQAFRDAVDGLAPGLEKHARAAAELGEAGSAWSMLDGKSVERIEDTIRNCIARRHGRSGTLRNNDA